MNRVKYEELLRKFAQELHDVGITERVKGLVEDQFEAHPNVVSAGSGQVVVKRFLYRHGGYLIEAKNTVELTIKKCDP